MPDICDRPGTRAACSKIPLPKPRRTGISPTSFRCRSSPSTNPSAPSASFFRARDALVARRLGEDAGSVSGRPARRGQRRPAANGRRRVAGAHRRTASQARQALLGAGRRRTRRRRPRPPGEGRRSRRLRDTPVSKRFRVAGRQRAALDAHGAYPLPRGDSDDVDRARHQRRQESAGQAHDGSGYRPCGSCGSRLARSICSRSISRRANASKSPRARRGKPTAKRMAKHIVESHSPIERLKNRHGELPPFKRGVIDMCMSFERL